jgi:hypothetical protein
MTELAKGVLSFQGGEALAAALRERSRAEAILVANRSALRALPAEASEISEGCSLRDARYYAQTFLLLFRAGAVARVAALFPSRAKELSAGEIAEIAQAIVADSPDPAGIDAAGSAAAAAEADTDLDDAAEAAADAAFAAARAYCHADPDAFDEFFGEEGLTDAGAYDDVEFLAGGGTLAQLADRPLWPEATPEWADKLWARILAVMPTQDDWAIWTRWYEERLSGAPSRGETYEIAFASAPFPAWAADTAAVNKWIKERVAAL